MLVYRTKFTDLLKTRFNKSYLRRLGQVLLGLGLTLLVACSEQKLTKLDSSDVILAFGDSLTQGVGVNKPYSYPSVLSRLSGLNVVNAGISGETTEEGLQRLASVIEQHNPGLLILIEGGNDILRNKPHAKAKSNLAKMIEIAKSRAIEVVLIGVPEKNLFSQSAPFYSELANEYDLVFDRELIGRLMRSPSKKSDSVHFNKAGYQAMAEGIYDLLVDNGAL
ncbi:MAG: GDSL-type esterase/lipase family protein [Kangiellaceae bacterium]|jgi:lysophospholipase L1-like esterase|nr:GDSL-type esterase/lipase family protein [Kangiellaceae bacterium]